MKNITKNYRCATCSFNLKDERLERKIIHGSADIENKSHIVTVMHFSNKIDKYSPRGNGDSVSIWIEDGKDHIKINYNYKTKAFDLTKFQPKI